MSYIEFQARFGGKSENISVPVGAVTAIYARETGTGMGFEAEASTVVSAADSRSQAKQPKAVEGDEASAQPKTDDKPQRPQSENREIATKSISPDLILAKFEESFTIPSLLI
jgi:stringent starvation protein B